MIVVFFDDVIGLVVINLLMVMVGGILVVFIVGKNDFGFVYNGVFVGFVVICVGFDIVYLIGVFIIGVVVGLIFVYLF